MKINDETFKIYKDFLVSKSGLSITPDKEYLLESRLNKIAKENNMHGLSELAEVIKSGQNKYLEKLIIQAMTTNETSFFRDKNVFADLEKVILPYFIKNRSESKTLRIWSAACSSGQETYTIAMVLKELQTKMPNWNIEIIGTDISKEVIDTAKSGSYSQFEIQRGLSTQKMLKYFKKNDDDMWLINDDIRSMVTFKEANLLETSSEFRSFDIIFCRNLLIYLDKDAKALVLKNIRDKISKDGVLLLGGTETIFRINTEFEQMQNFPTIHTLKNGGFKLI